MEFTLWDETYILGITEPVQILVLLLTLLAILFSIAQHPQLGKVFRYVPLLVFAYFLPTCLSNLGLIPTESIAYDFVRTWLLPASLFLLTLSVDIPAIVRLGPKVLILFLGATASIVLGGPLAYLLCSPFVPADMGDQVWKGLAALAGSWIGGGANFSAIGESVGTSDATLGVMIIVDVAVANVWMAVLLFFAGREKAMDEAIHADRTSLDQLREKIEKYQGEIARPTNLTAMIQIVTLALAVTAISTAIASQLPTIANLISGFTWVVILVTAAGVSLSFTKMRHLEGSGASVVGSLFMYLLIATIGAKGDFAAIGEVPGLILVGAVWMTFHAIFLLLLRWWVRAPIFFAAVGSKANVGGAASAPIVASAFHPALAPVGVLLAVAGYVLGTYAGLVCAFLLQLVDGLIR